MTLTHHNDPGHGWVEVSVAMLIALGIHEDISSFSYRRGGTAYLEEDRDAGVLCLALKTQGIEYAWKDSYTNDCFVRKLDRYWSDHEDS